MADFNYSLRHILLHEGLYANDADDLGGETYKGISRVNHPSWTGWTIIDKAKKAPGFPGNLEADFNLQALVGNLYKVQFWNDINGDYIDDQDVATSIFDFAINVGIIPCIKVAQKVLDVFIDGKIGVQTLEKLNGFDPSVFKDKFALAKVRYYLELCRKRPLNKKFLFSWISRSVLTLLVLVNLSSCITYEKCVDKYGQYPKDTVFVTIEKLVKVYVKVPSDSTQTQVDVDNIKNDTIYVSIDTVSKMTIKYWKDSYQNLLNIKAISPEKIFGDTIFLHDTIPCPPQTILVKEDSKVKRYWKQYCTYAGWLLPIVLLLVVFGLFKRK